MLEVNLKTECACHIVSFLAKASLLSGLEITELRNYIMTQEKDPSLSDHEKTFLLDVYNFLGDCI